MRSFKLWKHQGRLGSGQPLPVLNAVAKCALCVCVCVCVCSMCVRSMCAFVCVCVEST